MLVEFLCGRLPWRRLRDKELVGKMKLKTDSVKLGVDAGLPSFIADAWTGQLTSLSYFAIPIYSELHGVIEKWTASCGIQWSDPYDWQINSHGNLRDDHLKEAASPVLRRQFEPNQKRSTHETGFMKRVIQKKAYGSAMNLNNTGLNDGTAGKFNSTLAIADDGLTNQNKTQFSGCVTMATENNLQNEDDNEEASGKMDKREVLMASHGDLRNIEDIVEQKKPELGRKISQGFGSGK